MRNAIVGIVVGLVLGVVAGATLIAPSLPRPEQGGASAGDAADAGPERGPPAEAEDVPAAEPGFDAEGATRLRVTGIYPSGLPVLGALAKRLEAGVREASGGRLVPVYHEPGTLVPTDQLFEAVSSGAIDAALATPGLWSEREPALQLFSGIPFGPGPAEYLAWIYSDTAQELYRAIYARHNLHGVYCGLTVPKAGGWFRREIDDVSDFQGLRVGIDGPAGRVMARLGAEVRVVEGGDIFAALENGRIDATAFALPSVDLRLGFHRLAPHYYFPGWQQPAGMLDLMINRERWQALGDAERARIEAVCGDNVRFALARGEASQFPALKALQKQGARIHRWPPQVLAAFEKAWEDIAAEQAEADKDFARGWTSLKAFRRDYAIWHELGRLPVR